MDRYEAAFGSDWTNLEREDVLTRAFALGVAAACGMTDEGELSRLVDEVDTTYDRSMVELAFHEGRQKGGSLRPKLDDDAAVWAALVDEETGETVEVDDAEREEGDGKENREPTADGHGDQSPHSATARPTAISRATLLDRVDPDDREMLRFPRFLRRE